MQGQLKGKPKDPAKRHHLFKRRFTWDDKPTYLYVPKREELSNYQDAMVLLVFMFLYPTICMML